MFVQEKIRIKRIEKGLSQEYLAMKLGIDTATYGRIERGQIKLTINRFIEIANALETDPCYFFREELFYTNNQDFSNDLQQLKKINNEILQTLKTSKL
jgi:transcriptional regulator with XRE-family HTH domain